MQTDLSIRLRAYAATAEVVPATGGKSLYAEAVACSHAAAAATSAGIICSHSRILQGDSPPDYLLPGQEELEVLVADKPSGHGHPATNLPLRTSNAGDDTLNSLTLGASGIPTIKNRNADNG